MIGRARHEDGLYYFVEDNPKSLNSSIFIYKTDIVSNDNNVMLWHQRLGHPSFIYLRHLFSSLFGN